MAVKPTEFAFAGTVTEVGTLTAVLLEARLTLTPPVGAAPLSVTVQASVVEPVSDELLQERLLNAGVLTVPVPDKLITAVGLVDELLLTAS